MVIPNDNPEIGKVIAVMLLAHILSNSMGEELHSHEIYPVKSAPKKARNEAALLLEADSFSKSLGDLFEVVLN